MKKKVLSVFLAAVISATSFNIPVSAVNMETKSDIEEKEYEISVQADHGQVFFGDNTKSFLEAETVKFTIEPEDGYEIDSVNVVSVYGNVAVTKNEEKQYVFPMPGSDVIIDVSFNSLKDNMSESDRDKSDYENRKEEVSVNEEDSNLDSNDDSSEQTKFSVIDGDNAGLLRAETIEEEHLLEEIEEGNVIAIAPIEDLTLASAATVMTLAENDAISRASSTSSFTMNIGGYVNSEEVWVNNGSAAHHNGTVHRTITYTDDEGVTHTAPLYCMNASKGGPLNSEKIKDSAIQVLSNSNIKKILYYGYGGPGDISNSYDPTCNHVDWSKWTNRYLLTHFALSKVYANDVAGASATECAHIGLDKWIAKLTSMALPNVKDLKFYGKNTSGDTVTTNNISGNLTYWPTVPDSLSWTGMTNGVQISGYYRLTSTLDSNGIKFTRGENDTWVMGYWTSAEDYESRGSSNPRILGKGKSVTLKKGARVRFAFPRTLTSNKKFTYTSILKPIEYIAISSSIQTGQSNMQDLGTYYYEGARESLSLTFVPAATGKVVLKKVAENNKSEKIEGAGFHLKAAEDIISNGTTVIKKDAKVDGAYTDENGEITFSYIPIGKYYVMEVKQKAGTEAVNFEINETKTTLTVTKNATKTVTVEDIPKLWGYVSIRKVIEGTELDLEGAQFTVYSWSKASGKYTNGVKLTYNAETKRYVSKKLTYSPDNQGKFRVKETKNPKGFTGSWSKDIVLTKLGKEETFGFTVENDILPKRIEISKVDSITLEVLPDAEFTVYSWDNIKSTYENTGKLLSYDPDTEKYYSELLEITDLNLGKFKVVETKVPDGYTGKFEAEIDLNDPDTELQFTVQNEPIIPEYGTINIIKKDSETGALLEGAEFTIYQYNNMTGKYEDSLGNNASLSYDAQNEIYRSKALAITNQNDGKFKVTETKNPKGYTGNWSEEFVLSTERLELTFTVENNPEIPPVGSITVIKKIKDSDILWAHGNPVFNFVVEGTDIKGNAHKYENYICFSSGGYSVDESGYATLQITFPKVPLGSYQVYEKPSLYYYLMDCYGLTSNVAVTKLQKPAYGYNPKDIAYGSVQLSTSNKTATVAFVNTKARYDRFIHNDVIKNSIPIIFE